MNVQIKHREGQRDNDGVELIVNNNQFEIRVNIDNKGKVKVFGARGTTIEIPCLLRKGVMILGSPESAEGDEVKESLRVEVGAGCGMEGGLDIHTNRGTDAMFDVIPCIVTSSEQDKLIVKVRDGIGSWKKQMIWNDVEKEA